MQGLAWPIMPTKLSRMPKCRGLTVTSVTFTLTFAKAWSACHVGRSLWYLEQLAQGAEISLGLEAV